MVFPIKIQVSSSRLLSPNSPYFSRALFDGDPGTPWISGDILKNGQEHIILKFDDATVIKRIRILFGFISRKPNQKKFKECEELANKSDKYKRYKYKRMKIQNQILYKCFYQENPLSFSFPKNIELNFTTTENGKIKKSYLLPEPSKKKNHWYWFDIETFPENQLKPVRKLKINIRNPYYGQKYTRIAIGEIKIFGQTRPGFSGKKGRKQILKWFDNNKSAIIGWEFIFGKECRQIDGTRYIFGTNGDYEYITGLTSSTLGSERGKYFFDEQGIRIKYRRYEIFGNDIEDMNYSKLEERFLNIQYIDANKLLIQGNRCRIIQ